MSLIWEPIREAARERGWRFVAGEFAGLVGCFALAIGWVVAASILVGKIGVALCGR